MWLPGERVFWAAGIASAEALRQRSPGQAGLCAWNRVMEGGKGRVGRPEGCLGAVMEAGAGRQWREGTGSG